MTAVVNYISEALRASGMTQIQHRGNTVLVLVPLACGRTQMVKIVMHRGRHGDYTVLQCHSRACVATTHAIVRQALEQNMTLDCGGFALDVSVQPHVVDVVQGVVASDRAGINIEILLRTVREVAEVADAVENRQMVGADVF